jgi:lipopolysaccharide biosynthesis regulator YciM
MRAITRAFRRNARALPEAEAALRRALLAVLDRDYEAAEELIARALRADSDDPEAYVALARLYRARGEIGRAIRIHQNLLLRRDLAEETRTEALAQLAVDFRDGGFLRRAIAAFEEVLSRDRRHVLALRSLARLFREVRDYPRAIAIARRLAKLEGREPGADEAELQVALAERRRAEGRIADARRALKRALRGDPRSAAAWMALGDLELQRDRARAALAAFRRVPELEPRGGAPLYERLRSAFAAAGRSGDFEAFVREQLARRPHAADARIALARILAERDAGAEAIAELRAVLKQDPEHIEAICALGRVLLAGGRDAEALSGYAELLAVLERRGFRPSRESLA